ncbi:type IV secretory system conjugative DNA transfer family protein, partial [Candidatus Uhrbacteria bacterium]|nr:type IV secretory system conjugative DNA transfer family protein [Candidatus Uhrbacteria bacterium]
MSYNHDHENEVTYFAMTNFRNSMTKFGIKTDDRRRHMYVIGKTGMGKSVLLENLVLSDIYAGHGACFVDPHGDTAEKLIDYIPSWRRKDVVYFNPADLDFPVGFNILEAVGERHKHLVASGMMGVFAKIWEGMWSSRMEYILNNTILALLDSPGQTLLGINRMMSDEPFRKEIVKNIKDPVVRQFWVVEFASWSEKYQTEATAAIQNKIGQFLSAAVVRNVVAQVKSSINVRDIMDQEKIFIINLSKGRIGEDNSRLLGGLLITKIQLSAMERVDTPEHLRKDYYLYVDEFQNFAVESFANILSEARKYRLCLTMAHQYIAQLTEPV